MSVALLLLSSLSLVCLQSHRLHLASSSYIRVPLTLLALSRAIAAVLLLLLYNCCRPSLSPLPTLPTLSTLSTLPSSLPHAAPSLYFQLYTLLCAASLSLIHLQSAQLLFSLLTALCWLGPFEAISSHLILSSSSSSSASPPSSYAAQTYLLSALQLILLPLLRLNLGNLWQLRSLSFSLTAFLLVASYFYCIHTPLCSLDNDSSFLSSYRLPLSVCVYPAARNIDSSFLSSYSYSSSSSRTALAMTAAMYHISFYLLLSSLIHLLSLSSGEIDDGGSSAYSFSHYDFSWLATKASLQRIVSNSLALRSHLFSPPPSSTLEPQAEGKGSKLCSSSGGISPSLDGTAPSSSGSTSLNSSSGGSITEAEALDFVHRSLLHSKTKRAT